MDTSIWSAKGKLFFLVMFKEDNHKSHLNHRSCSSSSSSLKNSCVKVQAQQLWHWQSVTLSGHPSDLASECARRDAHVPELSDGRDSYLAHCFSQSLFTIFPFMSRYPDYLSPNVTPAKGFSKSPKSRTRREPSGVFSLFQPTQIQQFKEAFQLIDHDKDGWVNEGDLKEIFSSLGRKKNNYSLMVNKTGTS